MGAFVPLIKADLGPWNMVPILNNTDLIKQWRNIGGAGAFQAAETQNLQNTTIAYQHSLGTPWEETTPTGQWLKYCGYILYEPDGLGGRQNSGYNLEWQYRITNIYYKPNVTIPEIIGYRLEYRIAKVSQTSPLDVETLASFNFNTYSPNVCLSYTIGYIGGINLDHNNKTWFGFGFSAQWTYETGGRVYQVSNCYIACVSDDWFTSHNYEVDEKEITDPNEQDPGGESGEGGGDGGFNRDSDSNPVPGLPEINATDAGFVKLYYVTDEVLHLVAAEVYSSNFFDWLKDFLMKPTDMICGIAIVPFIPSLGVRGTHSFGSFSFTTELTSISSQYKVINCGSINIEKYYGSCFDYSPYTVLQIFLPFIGMRELDVDEVMGRSISVVYHCDCYTGACVAFITTPINNVDSVIAQYSGNILQQVPFGAGDFSQIVAATLSVATAVTGSIAAGGAAGAALAKEGATAGKIVSGAAAAAGENAPSITSSMCNVMSLKPRIEKASIAAGSSGQMSTLKPYLLRRIPRQSLPANYKELNGYPSNIAGPLSNFSGYAEIETIQLSGVNLTEPEITELLTILRGGVII